MAKVNISTAYSLWRGNADTKLPRWDDLDADVQNAITGTVRARDYLKKESNSNNVKDNDDA